MLRRGSAVRGAVWVCLLAAGLILGCVSAGRRASEPFLEKRDLFVAGDSAYKLYHIPGVVVTAKGAVLVWCEARKKGSDWDAIDILLRRSTDNGETFDAPRRIGDVKGPIAKNPFALRMKFVDPNDVTYNNPVLIPDRDGTVHALICVEYMRCFTLRSADDGVTWSEPVEITSVFEGFRQAYDWKVLATGPGHGIQLRNGRLVVPVWLSTGTGGNAHRPSVTATIVSDDGGKTWQAGEIAVPCTDTWINPNETVAVELGDGSVMLNVRSESTAHRRLVTISPDGATGWSAPRFDEALKEPICMGSIVRYPAKPGSGPGCLLFSNPDNLGCEGGKEVPGKNRDRKNLSVKLSRDDGRTWSANRVLEPGPSMYSDLAVASDGTIFCFYGRDTKKGFAGDRLTLARFNLRWVTSGGGGVDK
jgi:sialidase-1